MGSFIVARTSQGNAASAHCLGAGRSGVVKRIEEILRTVRTEASEYPADSIRERKRAVTG
jgi:hypothetical protein